MERKIFDGNDLNRIMDDFDFEEVHAYMRLTNRKWHNRLPTVEELRTVAEQFLWKVIESEGAVSAQGTGGFMAYKFPWGLKLTFEPFKSSNY